MGKYPNGDWKIVDLCLNTDISKILEIEISVLNLKYIYLYFQMQTRSLFKSEIELSLFTLKYRYLLFKCRYF